MKTPVLTPRQINRQRLSEGKPKLNFRLFRKVIKRIEEVPESYAQQVWEENADAFNVYAKNDGYYKKRPLSPCGGVACVAGETIICSEPTVKLGLIKLKNIPVVSIEAAKLLGLTSDEKDLFDGDAEHWIEPFRSQFKNAKTYKGEARAAINYLKYIIRTGKATE